MIVLVWKDVSTNLSYAMLGERCVGRVYWSILEDEPCYKAEYVGVDSHVAAIPGGWRSSDQARDAVRVYVRDQLSSPETADEAAEDDRFARELTEARRRGDMDSFARVLSGRLRAMDLRARAANKRADKLEALCKVLRAQVQAASGGPLD